MIWRAALLSVLALSLSACDMERSVADRFWPEEPAPWETVAAYYYPDRTNLEKHIALAGLDGLDACRATARTIAAQHNDHALLRGDYICLVGKPREWNGIQVYRIKVR
jgi:hypothetical protein